MIRECYAEGSEALRAVSPLEATQAIASDKQRHTFTYQLYTSKHIFGNQNVQKQVHKCEGRGVIPLPTQFNNSLIFKIIVKYTVLFWGFFIIFACQQTKQVNDKEVFNVEPIVEDSWVYYPITDNRIKVNLNHPQKASLFDYFSHIELIPLETRDDVLVGYCEEIFFYQNRYYIFDGQQHSIIVFDDQGEFIFQLKKRGQGPEEYIGITNVFLNPITETIDITYMAIIYSYDLSGKFVRRSLRPEIIPDYYRAIIAIHKETYICFAGSGGRNGCTKINYYNIEENRFVHQEYEDDSFLDTFYFISKTSPTPFYEYHGKWFFYRFVDNMTYEVGQDSLIKAYQWDFGRYNYDPKHLDLPDRNDHTSISALPYTINLQGQNNKFVIAQIRLRNWSPESGVYLMYDKSTNACKFIEHFDEPVDFLPRKVTNEYVLTFYTHGELDKYITPAMLDNANRKKFDALMNAKEEQNPVIIKYYFK